MKLEAIMRRARGLDGFQAFEAADAVVDVNDQIARGQGRDLGQKILRALGLALLRLQTPTGTSLRG